MEDTARANLYGVLYDMEYAISQVMNAPGFDDASRRESLWQLDEVAVRFAPASTLTRGTRAPISPADPARGAETGGKRSVFALLSSSIG